MVAMAQVATRVFGSTASRLCVACNSENPLEAAYCLVCGAIVGGMACPQCDATNQRNAHHCESCGHSLRDTTDICESVTPPAPAAGFRAGGLSPATLIGFGAVLSLAAASYPWYLFGGFSTDPEQQATLAQLLEAGWRGFPGIPLALIAFAAVASATVSLFRDLDTGQAAAAVVSGLVMLLSAAWLWDGFARMPNTADSAMPTTGALLATIGAIVVMTAGLHARSLLGTSTR